MFCRRQGDPLPMIAVPSDRERIVWLLIGEAQAQIAAASDDRNSHDVRALGLLGADVATIIGLTAARTALPPLWWIAVVALALCVPCFLLTIGRGSFWVGPDVGEIYAGSSRSGAAEVAVDLLADLQACLARQHRALGPKRRWFGIGLLLFVVGSLFAATFLLRVALIR